MSPRAQKQPSLLYVVKQLELAVRAQLDALLKPARVSVPQYTALTVLERRTTMSSADLARASFVRAQSTTDLVAGLERRGFIRREPDPENRRRLLISLTDTGRQLLAELEPLVAKLEERMVDQLDRPARAAFRANLNACRTALT